MNLWLLIPGGKNAYSLLQETISQYIEEENTSSQIRQVVKAITI